MGTRQTSRRVRSRTKEMAPRTTANQTTILNDPPMRAFPVRLPMRRADGQIEAHLGAGRR